MPEPPGLVVKKGTNKIGRVHDSLPFILHVNLHALGHFAPADDDTAAGFTRSIDRIVQNVDQQLLELRGISPHRDIVAPA